MSAAARSPRISSKKGEAKLHLKGHNFLWNTILVDLRPLKNLVNVIFNKCKLSYPSHRILALEKLGAVFNQVSTPVKYTPRKFAIDTKSNNLVLIESDHNAYSETAKQDKKQKIAEVSVL